MRLASSIVGEQAGPFDHLVDLRWVMAHNAGLGERSDEVHPLFPVCYEWPVSDAIRALPALRPIAGLLVHAQHDLVIHRPLKASETVRCAVRIVAAAPRSPGAFVVYRFETADSAARRSPRRISARSTVACSSIARRAERSPTRNLWVRSSHR